MHTGAQMPNAQTSVIGMRRSAIVVLGIGVLITGLIVTTFGARPALEKSQDRVENRWKSLRLPLNLRYESLGELVDSVETTTDERDSVKEAKAALANWDKVGGTEAKVKNPRRETLAAQSVEQAAARLVADAQSSPKTREVPEIASAIDAFTKNQPLDTNLSAYNNAVQRFENLRRSAWRKGAIVIFGYKSWPALTVSGS